MTITTKYGNGDTVYAIRRECRNEKVTCGFCGGRGKITGADCTVVQCPDCYGRGTQTRALPTKYYPIGPMTVGRVDVRITKSQGAYSDIDADNYKPQSGREEQYMLDQTGVGSGSVWLVDTLFPTLEEAQADADAQNAKGLEAVPS